MQLIHHSPVFLFLVMRCSEWGACNLPADCGRPDGLAQAIAASIEADIRIRADVELVAPGSLPNDGLVIQDTRTYE